MQRGYPSNKIASIENEWSSAVFSKIIFSWGLWVEGIFEHSEKIWKTLCEKSWISEKIIAEFETENGLQPLFYTDSLWRGPTPIFVWCWHAGNVPKHLESFCWTQIPSLSFHFTQKISRPKHHSPLVSTPFACLWLSHRKWKWTFIFDTTKFNFSKRAWRTKPDWFFVVENFHLHTRSCINTGSHPILSQSESNCQKDRS